MKVKDVVQTWHWTDECDRIEVLCKPWFLGERYEIASKQMDGDQYGDGCEPPYWECEVHSVNEDDGCLTITLG